MDIKEFIKEYLDFNSEVRTPRYMITGLFFQCGFNAFEMPELKKYLYGRGVQFYQSGKEDGYTKYRVDVVNRRFKIISKDTIQEVYWYNYGRSKKDQNWKYLNTFATFHPLKDKPDSNCWLKTKPWAWKDGIIK